MKRLKIFTALILLFSLTACDQRVKGPNLPETFSIEPDIIIAENTNPVENNESLTDLSANIIEEVPQTPEIAEEEDTPVSEDIVEPPIIEEICEPTFNENGEFYSQNIKDKVKSITNKIKNTYNHEFLNGDINFLDRDKLHQILTKCELQIINSLFLQNPELYGIYYPKLADCSMKVDRDNFIYLPEGIASVSTAYRQVIPPVVPKHISPFVSDMLTRIREDTGRKIFIESGYRSPYFQAYLFLDYYKRFGTVHKTAQYVAFPCRSEHGSVLRPAIDIILANGVSDQNPEVFASRKEFSWLLENSREFGFFLSFPGGNRYGYGFEPWHFHFEPLPEKISDIPTPLGMKRIVANDDWGRFIENLPLYPPGTRTKMLYRLENRQDGSEFIKSYSNYIYENYLRTFAVVNIPVSAYQDCSKHLVRLIAMYYDNSGKLQFPLADGTVYKYSAYDVDNFEKWLNEAMIRVGTLTWREILPKINDSENVQVGDILIEPATSHAIDPIYGDAVIGHTAVVVGIAYDERTSTRYYLIGSGSLPVTNFRIARAENRWQGQDGWLTLEGYLNRAHRDDVEFYRISDVLHKFLNN